MYSGTQKKQRKENATQSVILPIVFCLKFLTQRLFLNLFILKGGLD
jgi:hypothetical protein